MTQPKVTLLIAFSFAIACVYGQGRVNSVQFAPENISAQKTSAATFVPEGSIQKSKTIKGRSKPDAQSLFTSAVKAINESVASIEKLLPLQFKYAMLLNVDVESLQNIPLLKNLEKWMGTRYRLGGTSPKGIDCSALTGTLMMAAYGFLVPRTAREQYKATSHLKKDELEQGDLVFFNTHGGVSHVGLYLNNNYFVHASSSNGVIISSLDDVYYAKRFICGGRVESD